MSVEDGKTLESALNKEGPGSCMFVSCDLTKEDDIKVSAGIRVSLA